ncbi:MAG: type II and III secretion system protein family protein [Sphingomonadaceae bacterium]
MSGIDSKGIVRPELVEGLPFSQGKKKYGTSTSSVRTGLKTKLALLAAAMLPLTPAAAAPELAAQSMQGTQLDVPLNKSQVFRAERTFSKALIGSSDIADVLPLSNQSLYVLGKKTGTTTLTLYGPGNQLIQVVDVAVGPDVVSLRRQFSDLMPGEKIGAKTSNESVVLTGTASSAVAVDKAVQLASTYTGGPDKVVNMLTIGASQQVMLEVRFSEVNRGVSKQLGFNHSWVGGKSYGSIGDLSVDSVVATSDAQSPVIKIDGLSDAFGVGTLATTIGGMTLFSALDALEQKGLVKTLAEPTLVALSGETASFLAGGEFPIPVIQSSSGGGQDDNNGITIEYKPFGVSLAFTPTVLADGVISLAVAPEVSSIDPSASVTISGLVIPGLQTRRAKTVVELRDGQSFAIAGLLRNDFQDTVRQLPILGSLPIIGALFRSTGFQKNQSELVMIVTPRLVKPINNIADVRLPTDRVGDPHELDLFLMGRTDKAVGINPLDPNAKPPGPPNVPAKPAEKGKQGGFSGPTGYEL